MIRLPDIPPPGAASQQLASWQAEVDALRSHAARVEAAKRLFKQRNTSKNKTFVEVRRRLTAMCSGAQRCGYCEDSAADEVEHIRPKDLTVWREMKRQHSLHRELRVLFREAPEALSW